jgi:type II secretory pathway component GspD/PulD (secretin)
VAHILRHDFAINLLQSCVEVLLFYHPAVWWVSSQIRQERELCCDDLAVKTSGDALNYAAALTRLEALSLQAALPPPAARRLALAATGGSFMHRIQRLISPSSPTPLAPRAGLALLLLLGTGAALQARNRLLSSGTTQQAPQPAPRPLSMDLRQVDLPTVIRVLADQAGVNLVLSPDVQGKVDCQFTETPWDQILDAKLAPLGYAWELRNGVLHVAPASRLRDRVRLTEALVTARSAQATYSGRPISIDLRRVPLADLLRQVAAHGGVTVEVEPGVRGTFSFKFEDTPWDQVLDLILLTANLEWEFRGGVLHVRNRPEMPR